MGGQLHDFVIVEFVWQPLLIVACLMRSGRLVQGLWLLLRADQALVRKCRNVAPAPKLFPRQYSLLRLLSTLL